MIDTKPVPGDIVVCKVDKIFGYGVFVEVLDFPEYRGFVHISHVSSGWVKNIRNFVREKEIRVAKVLSVDEGKKVLDLSFAGISEQLKKKKLDEWRQTKRLQKLLEKFSKDYKISYGEVIKEIVEPLIDHYDSLLDAFHKVVLKKEKALEKIVKKKYHKPLVEFLSKNIEVPKKEVKAVLQISCPTREGILDIKEALKRGENSLKDYPHEIYYLGGGKYFIKIVSYDYKEGEKALKESLGEIEGYISSCGGEIKIEREY